MRHTLVLKDMMRCRMMEMTSISIRGCILKGKETNIYVEDERIVEVGSVVEADKVIDAKGLLAIQGLVNTHTHSAMTLLRGYADDMDLVPWLEKRIWPAEAQIKPEDVYWGTRLACLEMIKTGTTAFNDMYFHMEEASLAVRDSGVRALMGYGFVDVFNEEKREAEIKGTEKFIRHLKNLDNPRIRASVCPHAVYTVSDEGLQWCAQYALENDLPIHTHISETQGEVEDCMKNRGSSPVKHLEMMGIFRNRTIAAHCVWVSREDISTLARCGVNVSYNPVSNMKMGVGQPMPYSRMRSAGLQPSLGTDGSASNNNLDMFESMKFASLLQKLGGGPAAMPHQEAFLSASTWGARALDIPIGKIEAGMEADLILLSTKKHDMTPGHDHGSNIVYSANGSAVLHTICRGKILMEEGVVEGEAEVLDNVQRRAADLSQRASV